VARWHAWRGRQSYRQLVTGNHNNHNNDNDNDYDYDYDYRSCPGARGRGG